MMPRVFNYDAFDQILSNHGTPSAMKYFDRFTHSIREIDHIARVLGNKIGIKEMFVEELGYEKGDTSTELKILRNALESLCTLVEVCQ